ncbi:MAG TPA: pyridoxamine 5'-phosphate oxidase [Oligoflexia bacterium]|nr:pyridoxamine 5'-phosphate oxidase [Oligoflexia bacterium]HMP48470.1 pyridoxamine 5'-phosphate oxidase [Oligoflexia bacterium]
MEKFLEKVRKDYSESSLFNDEPPLEPFSLFSSWLSDALSLSTGPDKIILEPNAMALATSTKDGIPSVRFVLLKDFNEAGFSFFTNTESQKGQEINENPRVALAIYWEPLERQVRISGSVSKLSREDSESYFRKRPLGAQVAASISKQSIPLDSIDDFRARFFEEERDTILNSKTVPFPENWGGYRVSPEMIEFWKGRTSRVHERLRYKKDKSGVWSWEWLQP